MVDWLRASGHHVDVGRVERYRRRGQLARYPERIHGYDLVCLSVIFSCDAPHARRIALTVKGRSDVWCGGPGMWALAKWWKRETGLDCVVGLDARFERQRGHYRYTRASAGCPVGCWFCNVPTFEGKEFTLDDDFQAAPILIDNNLSALPLDFQRHIVNRYLASGVPLRDANSGFEPKEFHDGNFHLWRQVLRGPWRFALDEMKELSDVERVLKILRDEPRNKKRIYVLVGNEPIAACYERARKVIEWGGEPHCQYVWPLNYLGGPLWEKYDWTEQLGRDFCRYFTSRKHFWCTIPIWEYRPRRDGKAPFWFMRPLNMVA